MDAGLDLQPSDWAAICLVFGPATGGSSRVTAVAEAALVCLEDSRDCSERAVRLQGIARWLGYTAWHQLPSTRTTAQALQAIDDAFETALMLRIGEPGADGADSCTCRRRPGAWWRQPNALGHWAGAGARLGGLEGLPPL